MREYMCIGGKQHIWTRAMKHGNDEGNWPKKKNARTIQDQNGTVCKAQLGEYGRACLTI